MSGLKMSSVNILYVTCYISFFLIVCLCQNNFLVYLLRQRNKNNGPSEIGLKVVYLHSVAIIVAPGPHMLAKNFLRETNSRMSIFCG